MGVTVTDEGKIGTKIYYKDSYPQAWRIDKVNKIKTLTLKAVPIITIMPYGLIGNNIVYTYDGKIYIGSSSGYYYCVEDHCIVYKSSNKNFTSVTANYTSMNYSSINQTIVQANFKQPTEENGGLTDDIIEFSEGKVYFNGKQLYLPSAVNGTSVDDGHITQIQIYTVNNQSFALLEWYGSGYSATPYSTYFIGFGYDYVVNE